MAYVFLSLHACVCVHIHVCMQLNAIAQVWRSKGNLQCLRFSPTTFFGTGFLLFATHARPAGSQASGDSPVSTLSLTAGVPRLQMFAAVSRFGWVSGI